MNYFKDMDYFPLIILSENPGKSLYKKVFRSIPLLKERRKKEFIQKKQLFRNFKDMVNDSHYRKTSFESLDKIDRK